MLTRDDVNRRLASLPASQETPADYRYAAEREALETALALYGELQEARRLLEYWHRALLTGQFADVNEHTLAFLEVP